MTAVSLRPITNDNVLAVIALTWKPEQKGFVAANAKSLSQAYVNPEWAPLAIYAGEEPAGFAMYGADDDGSVWIIRYMIGADHQGRGYGSAALRLLLERMRAEGAETIWLSCDPANAVALGMYERQGFRLTGDTIDDELVLRADLSLPTA